MPSILDVARHAGVSPATASRVLSDAKYPVSKKTREKVLAAAQAIDFVPNALARGLVKRHLPIVGVIVHDITDPYFGEVVRGVEDAATPAGYLVITSSSDRRPDREESYVRLMRSMRAAIVIFAGSGLDDPALNEALVKHLGAIRAYGGAVIHQSPNSFEAPEVAIDNARATASMIAALVVMGHRRIAFLAGPSHLYVARERLDGYRSGLRDAAIDYDPALVFDAGFTRKGGADGVDHLLRGISPFTAIACANDLTALGVLQRLRERNVRVPEQVSVSGFDDILIAAEVAPSLTTVRMPLHEIGRQSFEYAQQVLEGKHPRRQTLDTEVILRESTGSPPLVPLGVG